MLPSQCYCKSLTSAERILFANGMLFLFVCLSTFPFLPCGFYCTEMGSSDQRGCGTSGQIVVLCTISTASNCGLHYFSRTSITFLPHGVRHPFPPQRGCVMLWSGTVNHNTHNGRKREKRVKDALEMQAVEHVNSQQKHENLYCQVTRAASSERVVPL